MSAILFGWAGHDMLYSPGPHLIYLRLGFRSFYFLIDLASFPRQSGTSFRLRTVRFYRLPHPHYFPSPPLLAELAQDPNCVKNVSS